jgi:hypothetical protein
MSLPKSISFQGYVQVRRKFLRFTKEVLVKPARYFRDLEGEQG